MTTSETTRLSERIALLNVELHRCCQKSGLSVGQCVTSLIEVAGTGLAAHPNPELRLEFLAISHEYLDDVFEKAAAIGS